jgi:hypothetical protein
MSNVSPNNYNQSSTGDMFSAEGSTQVGLDPTKLLHRLGQNNRQIHIDQGEPRARYNSYSMTNYNELSSPLNLNRNQQVY